MEYEEMSRERESARYSRVSVDEDEGRLPFNHHESHRKSMAAIVDDLDHDLEYHDPEPEPVELGPMTIDERVRMLLDGTPFQATMACSILLNAAVIGGETDYPMLDVWHMVENIFLAIFLVELLLRMFAVGLSAFFKRGGDQLWNLFDFAIVGLGIFDFFGGVFGAHKHIEHHDGDMKDQRGGGFSTLFRMIRLLRILRVFKIVRFVKPLYMIFFGFAEAVQAACLVTILAFGSLYVSSVIMVRTYGRLPPEHSKDFEVLVTQFSNIKTSMLSLFELMANPGNLQTYHDLMQDYPILTGFLIGFVIFGYGMVAVLTGVISESMFDKNLARVQEMRSERESKRDLLKQKCHELFELVEVDNNREAAPQDLEALLPYVREMFEKLNIEYMQHEFENIIKICDTDDTGGISESEFVSVIMSLCDGVRAASIQEVHYLASHMNIKVTKTIPRRIESLHDEVQQITRTIIPELQGHILNLLHKIEPQLRSSGGLFDPVAPLVNDPEQTAIGLHFSEMDRNMAIRMDGHEERLSRKIDDFMHKIESQLLPISSGDLSMASRMEDHTERLSRKIDDLTANVRDICKMQDVFYGDEYTLPDAQMASAKSAGGKGKCLPVSPESKPSKGERNTAGIPGTQLPDHDQRNAPSSAPHANPELVVFSTLTKQRPSRPVLVAASADATSGGNGCGSGCWGKGEDA